MSKSLKWRLLLFIAVLAGALGSVVDPAPVRAGDCFDNMWCSPVNGTCKNFQTRSCEVDGFGCQTYVGECPPD